MNMTDRYDAFTYDRNSDIVHIDDWVTVSRSGEDCFGEILEIAQNGCHVKIRLDTGDIIDVSSSQIVAHDATNAEDYL